MKKIPLFLLPMFIITLLVIAAGCTENASKSVPVISPGTPAGPVMPSVSNETLVSFVDSAVAYATTHGTERALSEFNNRNGSFIQGELYIFAYGYNGTTLAHPINPETVGKPREGANGIFVREMGGAVRNGSGFYRFTYINPQHNNTLESKLGYGVQVADDWWLGSGVYTGPVNAPATATAVSPKTP